MQDPADEQAADCADDENRAVGFGHDRIGQAQKEPEENADEPYGPGELHAADGEPDREPAGKRAEQRGARLSGNCIGNMSATATAAQRSQVGTLVFPERKCRARDFSLDKIAAGLYPFRPLVL